MAMLGFLHQLTVTEKPEKIWMHQPLLLIDLFFNHLSLDLIVAESTKGFL